MKIILFIFLTLSLNADDILTQYRLSGISVIEKQLDLKLTSEEYWNKELENKDTSFGYLESYNSILICDKNSSNLSLYKLDTNNTFTQLKTYDAFTGKIPGDKKFEGDLKTPLGIYKIEQRLDKESKLDPFYGPLAFVTSYPNIYDRSRGKRGSGIWVHGFPINQTRDDFTRGCIAIDNESIKCLDNNIDINNTILIINKDTRKVNVPKKRLNKILTELYKWRYAWKYSDIYNYLSFYAKDFKKTDGTHFDNFKIAKEFVFNKKDKKIILFNNINILKYPNTQNIYQISFHEIYKTKYISFIGNKTLMVKVDEEDHMKIFLEN